jgi:hypothetical protein
MWCGYVINVCNLCGQICSRYKSGVYEEFKAMNFGDFFLEVPVFVNTLLMSVEIIA